MRTLSRSGATGAVMAAVMAVLLMPSVALANPTPVEQAEASLIAIQQQSSAIDQQYTELSDELVVTQERLAAATETLEVKQAEVDELQHRVASFALAEYRQPLGQLWTAARLLAAPDPETFLSQLSTVRQVNESSAALLTHYKGIRDAAAALKATAEADSAAIARDQALLQRARDALAAQMEAAKQIVDRLTAAQKAELMARRLSARRQTVAATTAAPSASPTPTPKATPTPTPSPSSASPTPTPSTTLTSPPADGSGQPSKAALQALAYAEAQLGKAYVMGATGPDAFDCSGLTLMAYRSAGVSLPRTAAQQATVGTPVALSDLIPGDLVFYYTPISHVGIYAGNGIIVNAESPILGVVKVSVTWMPFTTGRRVA